MFNFLEQLQHQLEEQAKRQERKKKALEVEFQVIETKQVKDESNK